MPMRYYDPATAKYYDTNHLKKHVIEYIQLPLQDKPECRYSVEVSYSNHCFTKAGNETDRIFDLERYEESKRLPQIMGELMSRECHHTGKNNFVTFDLGEGKTYEIYFEVFKNEGLKIRVQSAYIRDPHRLYSQPGRSKIKFSTILFNTQHDKPIHPPRQKSRRG